MKSCNYTKYIGDFLRKTLRVDRENKVQQHLKECNICQNRMVQEDKLSDLLASIRTESIPDDVAARTLNVVFKAMDSPPRRTIWIRLSYFNNPRWKVLVPATVSILILFSLLIYSHSIFLGSKRVSDIYSVATLGFEERTSAIEDPFLNVLDVEGRERSEANEVLFNFNAKTQHFSDDRLIQTIEYSQTQSQKRHATYLFFNSQD